MNNAISGFSSEPALSPRILRRRLARLQTKGLAARPAHASLPTKDGVHDRSLPSRNSESAHQATLNGAKGRRADSLKIEYRHPEMGIELWAGAHSLLSGRIKTELIVDRRSITPCGEWESVCWHSDDDGDYLELRLSVGESLRIERQFFLSRDDHFCLVADAVIATGASRVEHRLLLPVPKSARVEADVPTRECVLQPARVFPLWLPQDRIQSAAGACHESDGGLALSYAVAGPGLYLPLMLDWHPRRRRCAVEWRSLTVTEPGRVVSPGEAAGHRLRIGKNQLLLFRGLASSHEPRAVLGQHTWYETLIAKFDSDGDLDPIMATEVE